MKKYYLIFFFLYNLDLFATHIVGGDITVKHLTGNDFEVTMHIYRDCINGTAGFDNPSTIGLYDKVTHAEIYTIDMPLISVVKLQLADSCLPASNLCVEDGLFIETITIPNNPNGYYLSWQRCCRNGIINNIVNPGSAGMVVYCEIADPALQNSTPVFTKPYPNPVMCNSLPSFEDYSAMDSDGDLLLFSLVPPLNGNLTITTPVGPPSSGPYSNVIFQVPYSAADMIGGTPAMTINSSTGLITANPNTLGVYVFAVRVEEFRNGVKIGEIRREMQYKVVACPVPVIPTSTVFNCSNQQLTAAPGYATYSWTNTSTGGTNGIVGAANTQSIVVNQGGTYQVVTAAVAGSVCTASALVTVVVNPTPIANFISSTGCDATTTQFTDFSSPLVGLTSWAWDFNNDGITDSSIPNPTNTFPNAGVFPVTLIVSQGPCNDTITINVTVDPGSSVSAGPDQTICAGSTVILDGAFTGFATMGTWTGGTGAFTPDNITPNAMYTPSAAEEIAGTVTLAYTTDVLAGPCGPNDDQMTITINPNAIADAGPPQTICSGASATLAGSIGGAGNTGTWGGGTGTYVPDNNTLNAVYTPSAAEIASGSVTLTLVSNDPVGPCPSATSTVTITINPLPTVNAGSDQVICIRSSATLAGIVGATATSGSWSGGTGIYNPNNTDPNAVYTPSAAEEIAGVITLTFTSDDPAGPCSAVSDQMTITIAQMPTAYGGISQFVCPESAIVLAGVIGGSATSGTWSGGNGIYLPDNATLDALYAPSSDELAAGFVTLTLTTDDPIGPCPSNSSAVTFNFYPNPVVNFSVDVPKGCPIHCVNFSDLATVAAPGNITTWNWNFGDPSAGIDNTSGNQNPAHCYTKSGFYDVSLIVTTNNGCTGTLTIPQIVEVYALPVAEFDTSQNPSSILEPLINFGNKSSLDVVYWNWNFGDGASYSNTITPNPSHLYSDVSEAIYMVTLIVHNANGCWDTVVHSVKIGPDFTFYIPNAFTPNADGVNDTFFGQGIGIKEYNIWIYDRWGNKVFHTDDISDGWNGNANYGKETAQQDVFVWKVTLKDVFGKIHRYMGTVTLVK